jgi:hypothetical protein
MNQDPPGACEGKEGMQARPESMPACNLRPPRGNGMTRNWDNHQAVARYVHLGETILSPWQRNRQ